jgi:hypothetical protein
MTSTSARRPGGAQGERPWFLLADVCRAMGIKPNKGSFYRQADMLADYEKRFPSREEAQLLLEMGKNPAFRTAPQNLRGGSKHSNIGNFVRARVIAESGVYVLYATGKDIPHPGTSAKLPVPQPLEFWHWRSETSRWVEDEPGIITRYASRVGEASGTPMPPKSTPERENGLRRDLRRLGRVQTPFGAGESVFHFGWCEFLGKIGGR